MLDESDTIEPAKRPASPVVRAPGLTILYHPDTARVGERVLLTDLSLGKPVGLSRTDPSFVPPGGGTGRGLADPCISRKPVVLRQEKSKQQLTLDPRGMALTVNGVPLRDPGLVALADLEDGVVLELADRVVLLLHWLGAEAAVGPSLGMVGANASIEALRRDVLRVADLEVPVLVRGETGTGKELVARAIHDASRRAAGPFVSVNMAVIRAETAASELFGHTRGAFTGATSDHAGYFGRAEGGTLFLDEIGATPVEVQPMLLRALESLEIQPLGSAVTRRANVRIVAATDAEIEQAIDEGSFRAAVYHRLEGYQLFVPPLRRRRDDFGRLLIHFVRRELDAIGELDRLNAPDSGAPPWLGAPFVARLARLSWPGNVRQLRNVVRQFTISSRGLPEVRIDAALERMLADSEPSPARTRDAVTVRSAGPLALSDDDLLAALRACDFRVPEAAEALGISRSALYDRIRASSRIRQAKDLSAEELEAVGNALDWDVVAMARQLDVSARALALRISELGLSR